MLSKLKDKLAHYQKLSQEQSQAIKLEDIKSLDQIIKQKEDILADVKSLQKQISSRLSAEIKRQLEELKILDDQNILKLKKLQAAKARSYQQQKEKEQVLSHYAKNEE